MYYDNGYDISMYIRIQPVGGDVIVCVIVCVCGGGGVYLFCTPVAIAVPPTVCVF